MVGPASDQGIADMPALMRMRPTPTMTLAKTKTKRRRRAHAEHASAEQVLQNPPEAQPIMAGIQSCKHSQKEESNHEGSAHESILSKNTALSVDQIRPRAYVVTV